MIILSGCSKFRKNKLSYRKAFSIPINKDQTNNININKISDFFFEIPTTCKIYNKDLYLIDNYNNKVLKYNDNNELTLTISNKMKKIIDLVYTGSNRILQPLHIHNRLFSFNDLGSIQISRRYIYLENIIFKTDEGKKAASQSLILRYDPEGMPDNLIGLRMKKSNKIYPLRNLEKFSVDKNDNTFVYLKDEEHWRVRKFNTNNKTLFRFSSYTFFQEEELLPDKSVNEKIVIENIDNSFDGQILVLSVAYFNNEIEFRKVVYYKVDIQSGQSARLFTIRNERLNYVLLDDKNRIYMWETKGDKNNIEYITIRLYNLKGKAILNYLIKLDRADIQWFDIKIQKDKLITGVNIQDNKFNVVVWE